MTLKLSLHSSSHAGFHCCFPHLANCTSSATSRSHALFPVQHAKSHRSHHNVTDLRAKVSFVSHDLDGPPAYATIARGRRSFLMRSIVFFFPSVTPRNLANWQLRQPRSCSVFYTLPKTCGIVWCRTCSPLYSGNWTLQQPVHFAAKCHKNT